tara:strand:- start:35268 stop:36128 length:861 start_codon:yes stop_codon:yes gene_type:complete
MELPLTCSTDCQHETFGKKTTTAKAAGMPDVQGNSDDRMVAIDRVGVKEVVYPMRLATRDGGEQTTVATINMYVSLPQEKKGTHMSRFLEVLNEHQCSPFSPKDIPGITKAIKERLNASNAHFEASFTYFIEKPAPVTGQKGLMNYEVKFECTANSHEDFVMTVAAPATSLCPCSKEISEYGAHNQRCRIAAAVRTEGFMWIEDLVEHLEGAASHPVYAVLKRPDEKYVTEKAFENPKFVEDIIRDLALGLNEDDRVVQYAISSENFESIHSHNAYAEIERDKRRD